MFDVITFGSSTGDVFIKMKEKLGAEIAKQFCFNRGDKVETGEWQIFSGGGGANTACTFALQGLKIAYCGMVGNDYFGELNQQDLKNRGVDLRFFNKVNNRQTALSVILSSGQNDRLIFAGPGACHFQTAKNIAWSKIKKTKWFYIAPLHHQSCNLLKPLVDFAVENKIKVALNPSEFQIKNSQEELKQIIAKVDVLLLNSDEATLLGEEIYSGGAKLVVVTEGEKGAKIFDGSNYYTAGIFPIEAVERTGAGDSFGSGLVAGLLLKNDIKYAIRLAMANSASCLKEVGAKNGLLRKGEVEKWPLLDIKKS
ncbi:MAG: carbohydrate kinase family protein [Candidatus Gribaldobacteria bacterium]|nr:carbohydrate kinase family protein [Candidatus Gribaldobacteria bacterium]